MGRENFLQTILSIKGNFKAVVGMDKVNSSIQKQVFQLAVLLYTIHSQTIPHE